MKKIYKLLIILAISIGIFVVSVNFGGLYYEDNDDVAMNMIAAGAYGEGSQYLLCSGIVIGRLIKTFYSVFGNVNCYLWTYLILNLISVISIIIVISDEFDVIGTAVTSVLVSIFFARDFYISLQFSKNSALYAAAGFFLVVSYVYRRKKEIFRLLVASFLLPLSHSARKEEFYFLVPFGVVALIVMLITYIRSKEQVKIFLPLLIPVVCSLISIGANHYAFVLDPDWNDYYVRDKILTEKRDFGNYNFSWNEQEYLDAGFTEWDFRLLDEWYYNDVDNFSVDKIKLMKQIGESTRIDRIRWEPAIFNDTCIVIRDAFKEGPLAAVSITAIAICAVYCIRKKKYIKLLGVVALAGGIFIECYYLANVRRALWRVEYGSWLAGALLSIGISLMPDMAVLMERLKETATAMKYGVKIKKIGLAGIVLATAAVTLIWQIRNIDYSYDNYAYSDTERYELFQNISKSDGFFVVNMDDMFGGLNGARNIMEIDRRYAGLYSNITAAGGYVIPAPNGMYYAHQRGITNVYGSLADRDDMYYVGGGEHMGYILMYINEKYGPGIEVRQEQFDGFTAWKFYRSGL